MLFNRPGLARRACQLALVLFTLPALSSAWAQHTYDPKLKPVATISDTFLAIHTSQGDAALPLYVSVDWTRPQPQIERAVIVIHGKLRNADTYFHSAEKARAAAGGDPASSLLIAPQFLATIDARRHGEPDSVLRWQGTGWMGGEPAQAPVPLSSFAALDAIVERLADRHLFPNLKLIVVAGHSAGAQVVQRYAIAMHELPVLRDAHIPVRFLLANPSSYAYFDAQRPNAEGLPAVFDATQCPGFNDWKYGMQQRPVYVAGSTPAQLEQRYAQRDVTYLIGGNDDDPQQAALDKSCPAEAEGPQRMARAQAYFHYMQLRHPHDLNQSFHVVPGVGHSGSKMLTSSCALTVMFGDGQCKAQPQ